MPTFLLDKNVVRRAIGSLRRISSPTPEEATVLEFLFRAQAINAQLFISQETVNLLKRYASRREAQFLLSLTRVLLAAPYFRRWARRVRDEGFTREDAKVLGLATFGTTETGELLGIETIVTLDRPLIRHYASTLPVLQKKLAAMATNLAAPFCCASLPKLSTPHEALSAIEKLVINEY